MIDLIIYVIIAFLNVFFHIVRSIFVINSTKFIASITNCICYTFSAIVIKYIAEVDLVTAIIVQSSTNFMGCYIGMLVCEKVSKYVYRQKEIS